MIYVLSDIHGQSRRFHSILSQIDLKAEDTLYILGDVIDRNPDSERDHEPPQHADAAGKP